ncbi:MAG: PDZ domain-containing protein [Verrucomicrobiales bacterium]|nr:PDZ domain-containing protein [Verrucomicrobiales bacterium]
MKRSFTIAAFLLISLSGATLAEKRGSLLDLLTLRPSEEEKANQAQLLEILNAFKPTVADASKGTVWILEKEQRLALGTVVSEDGLILTKASEVEGRSVRCQFGDGTYHRANIERSFPKHDVAFLRVKRTGLRVPEFTNTAPIIGSLIATPSPRGDVSGVGIVSVGVRDLSGQDQGYLGISIDGFQGGLKIREVKEDSAASEAGLRNSDVLLSIDGKTFSTVQTFAEHVSMLKPGKAIRVGYRRGRKQAEASVVLGSREEAGDLFDRAHAMDLLGGATSKHRTGYPKVWQHDIGLAPFRMGGPVVDLEGRILGINIARSGRVKTYAIPSSLVLEWLGNPKTPIEPKSEQLDQLLRELEEAERALKDANKALDELPEN